MPEASSDISQGLAAALDGHRLTPTQQRIASYLEQNPIAGATLDSVELAARVEVSQASVSRFAHVAGFDGYAAFRRWLRRFISAQEPGSLDTEGADRFTAAIRDEIHGLEALRGRVREHRDDITRSADLLATSPVLPVVGLRASAGLAQHVAFFAGRFHSHVELITAGDSSGVDRLRRSAEAGATAALIVAVSRTASETQRLTEVARDRRLDIVLLTTSAVHPLSADSSVVLAAATSHKLMFDAMAAPTMLAGLLLDAMADVEPATTRQRIEAFERTALAERYFL